MGGRGGMLVGEDCIRGEVGGVRWMWAVKEGGWWCGGFWEGWGVEGGGVM